MMVATYAWIYFFMHLIVHMAVSRCTQELSGEKSTVCFLQSKAKWLGSVKFCHKRVSISISCVLSEGAG